MSPLVRRLVRLALALVALAAVFGGLAVWQAESVVGELQAGEKREVVAETRRELGVAPAHPLDELLDAKPSAPDAPERGVTNLLLIGSDQRWGSGEPGNADSVLLVRVDEEERTISVLSVPRDLRVPIPGHGRDRVNEAYARGGPALLARTLREYFGVTIDHFADVDFGGFRRVVSALGGVYVPVDQRYFNENLGTPGTNYAEIDLRPGYQLLDGDDALAFARYRHGDSDLFRVARQQLFLRQAVRQVVAQRHDFLGLRGVLRAFAEATTSDIDSTRTLWRLFAAVRSTPGERVSRLTVPVDDAEIGGAYFLESGDAERRKVMARWREPTRAVRTQVRTTRTLRERPAASAPERRLLPDAGGEALLSRLDARLSTCAPSALPRGYGWASDDPARAYELEGHPAVALVATAGSGRSLLWTFTTWDEPPVLDRPSRTVERGGRAYDVYYESGSVRQVAWTVGDTLVWVTNTLRNELSAEEMIALAASCERRG